MGSFTHCFWSFGQVSKWKGSPEMDPTNKVNSTEGRTYKQVIAWLTNNLELGDRTPKYKGANAGHNLCLQGLHFDLSQQLMNLHFVCQ